MRRLQFGIARGIRWRRTMHTGGLGRRTLFRAGIGLAWTVSMSICGGAFGQATHEAPYAVGMKRAEFIDNSQGRRQMAMVVFYPAVVHDPAPATFSMPFFTNLRLYQDADMAPGTGRRPLVIFSHGRGSTGLYYAWFAQFLASHGYIVAAVDHYRANSYDSSIVYLANKLWQRPVDLNIDITFLLSDPFWSKYVDPSRIGVAGHSQGGFTALWIGGAKVNADKYLAFQRKWRNNEMVPAYLREQLPLDAQPALDVRDSRIKAVFAMAPGVVKPFGMDEAGLRQLTVPTYIVVGEKDTQTPAPENAEFAAQFIPHAQLNVLAGRVDHEIFVNECNEDGRNENPDACVDAPGIDRRALHDSIGNAALKFFDTNLDVSHGQN
jgi:predicted dienelactone hydrolase